MKKVISITDLFGNPVDLSIFDIIHIGTNDVLVRFKKYGFVQRFAPCDGYTVIITEE